MVRRTVYSIIDSFNSFIVEHYRSVILLLLFISIPMAFFYTKQRHENHIGIYFDKDNNDLIYYRQFQERFGNEEFVMAVFKEPDIFTKRNMDVIRDITMSLESLDGVEKTLSLVNVKEARSEDDAIVFKKIVPDDYCDLSLKDVRRRALSDRNLVNSVVSPDGTTTAVFARLTPVKDEEKRLLVRRITASMTEAAAGRVDLRIAGVPVAEARMNTLSARDYNVFTPVTLLMIFLVVAMTLRNWTLSFLTIVNMALIFAWGIGIYCMAGETFNMLTVILGPMLLITAIEHSVHVLAQFEEDYVESDGRNNYSALVKRTVREVWVPCFFTSATTAMGFISFCSASVQPVQTLGIFTAVMVLMGFMISIIFLPAALMFLEKRLHANMLWRSRGVEPGPHTGLIMKMLMGIARFDLRRYRLIAFTMTGILLLSAALGIYRLHFETNIMQYLSDSDRTKQDILFIEQNLGGTIPFAVTIKAGSPEDDFSSPESIRLVKRVQDELVALSGGRYTYSLSIADYFPEIHRAFNGNDSRFFSIPSSRTDILDYYEVGDQEVISRLVSPDMMETSINFQSVWGSNVHAVENFRKASARLNEILGGRYTWRITGLSTLYIKMESNLMKTQVSSFILSFVMIFFMMYFVCGSIPLTIISMAPNMFPVFITLGIMGALNIPFDVATVMIGSVTLGIVVNDTTHYIIWFRRNMAKGMGHSEAIEQTFRDVGKPTFVTSLVLCLGFSVLVLGSIKPTQYFGLFSSFAMIMAPLGDYIMLPALIMLFKPKVRG